MKQPPKYKIAIIIWLAVYPTANIILFFLGDYLMQLPLLLRTFILTVIMVFVLVFFLEPLLTKVFSKWLSK